MHEFSVVQDFLRLCEEHVREQNCRRVVRARVKAGEFSGIELALFRRALEAFAPGSVLEGAQVDFDAQPLVVACSDCGYEGASKRLVCPRCTSAALRVLDGEEFVLMQLELE